MKLTLLCLIIFLTGFLGNVSAQKSEVKNLAAYPYWIQMMDDSTTNYFEAMKAFDNYWKGREQPHGEGEEFADSVKTMEKNIPYTFEYMRFKNWQILVQPYVQDDGSILYPYQQLQLRQNARRGTPADIK
ncbi:MAG: hypothetical protein ACLQQ4_17160 [Bacteroidia bacterium]